MAQMLLDLGSQDHLVDEDGLTPSAVAEHNGFPRISHLRRHWTLKGYRPPVHRREETDKDLTAVLLRIEDSEKCLSKDSNAVAPSQKSPVSTDYADLIQNTKIHVLAIYARPNNNRPTLACHVGASIDGQASNDGSNPVQMHSVVLEETLHMEFGSARRRNNLHGAYQRLPAPATRSSPASSIMLKSVNPHQQLPTARTALLLSRMCLSHGRSMSADSG